MNTFKQSTGEFFRADGIGCHQLESVYSPVKKETKMITRLNIHVDAAPSAQEEQRLDIPVFAKTVPHSNGAQIALYARIAGTEVPLVGLLISRDSGKLVATRWVTGSVADEFVERDTAGRIRDRWAERTK